MILNRVRTLLWLGAAAAPTAAPPGPSSPASAAGYRLPPAPAGFAVAEKCGYVYQTC